LSDILWRGYAKEAGFGFQNNFPDYVQLKAARNYPHSKQTAEIMVGFRAYPAINTCIRFSVLEDWLRWDIQIPIRASIFLCVFFGEC